MLLAAVVLGQLPAAVHASCRGCVELDELTFDRVLDRFRDGALVKFDIAYPYGDKQDTYEKFAVDVAASFAGGPSHHDLLIAAVGVKDYGDKDNQALAKRFGVSDKYPQVYLFTNGASGQRVRFPDGEPFTVDNLKQFVRHNSAVYIGLPGCSPELDALAGRLVEGLELSEGDERLAGIVKEARQLVDGMVGADRPPPNGAQYVRLMELTVEKGLDFVGSEAERVRHLLAGKVSDKKRKELEARLNILMAFRGRSEADAAATQEEL